jgi:DNA polymerase V
MVFGEPERFHKQMRAFTPSLTSLEQKNKQGTNSGDVMSAMGEVVACITRLSAAIPHFMWRVQAGFPSPAEDYLENPLDFNELLIAHPAATFAVRVTGDSMQDVGIFPGDIAVVDRAITALDGSIVLGVLNGEFTLKRYRQKGRAVWLEAANPAYAPIVINEDHEFEVWGVVRHAIRRL